MKYSNNFAHRSVSATFGALILTLLFAYAATAQTSAFTYQGRFTDASAAQPTNGTYTMTFRLYDAATGGNQIPDSSTAVTSMVSVVSGVFSVKLDFGAAAFNTTGARYLEVQIGSTVLAPRQEINAAPFASRSVNAGTADALSANCVGCVTDAKIASGINYSKLTGAPTNLPPTGAAGGDLTGSYPNPTIAGNVVTSAKIADGTIVNADINASAAIDGTKIVGNTITNLNASNLGTGTIPDGRLSGNVTVQGNTFNGANQLVKLDAGGKIPAIDGSQITNINASPGGLAVFLIAANNTYAIATGGIGNNATRTFIASMNGANGTGVITIIITLPPANSYASGTVLRIAASDYVTGAPSLQFQKTASTSNLLHGFNQGTGAAGPGFPGSVTAWATDGVSNWYKVQ